MGHVDRRRLLAMIGALGIGSAGCGALPDAERPPIHTEKPASGCDGGRTPAPDFYDEHLIPIGPGDYDGTHLRFQTIAPRVLLRPDLGDAFEPYVFRATLMANRLALGLGDIHRITSLAPGSGDVDDGVRMAYVVFRTDVDRDRWLARWKLSVNRGDARASFAEEEPYRNFSRIRNSFEWAVITAFDDAHVIVAPETEDPLRVSASERVERLIDLKAGEARPHHCLYPDARALVAGLPVSDFVSAWFRADGATFPKGHLRAPRGARAAALTVDLRDSEVSDGGQPDTATEASDPDGVTALRIAYTVIFPEGETDLDAVERYVERQLLVPGGAETVRLGFIDPRYDRASRAVTVTETRDVG